jgi:hypothetical protein
MPKPQESLDSEQSHNSSNSPHILQQEILQLAAAEYHT